MAEPLRAFRAAQLLSGLCLLVGLGLQQEVTAQPVNDNPCGAVVLTPNVGCVNTAGTNVAATATSTTGLPGPGCANYSGGDVWYRVTVPASGQVTVTTSTVGGSALTDSGMGFYTAATCAGPFTLVSCNNDIIPVFNQMSTLTYAGAVGTVLYVRVWERGNNAFGTFNICATAPAPPPTNDNPCGATALSVGAACTFTSYTNVGTTNSAISVTPTCGNFGAGSMDVWFSFVAPATGIAIIETQAGTMTDAAMALYYDDPPLNCNGPFTLVECDDDLGPGLMPFISFTNLVPGGTYYIRVWGYGTATGTFGLCVHAPTTMPAGQCVYMLQLYDSFGDGWGSSSVGISINGGPATNYSVNGSYNIALIGLNIGQVLIVSYTASGPNQGQNNYRLGYYPGGTTIFSSGTPPVAGTVFTQVITCQPPPPSQSDCLGGSTVCNAQSFNNNANSTGNVVDLSAANRGCLASGERQGTWYYFSPSSNGTVGFTIAPVVATDYDFAVWGPMAAVTCPPPGPPLRCSYAAPTGNTGCGNGATDLTEGAAGDRWVSTFNVLSGQVYILYVDNFSTSGQSFGLSWQLSNGASLDCTVLPIELHAFAARDIGASVELTWTTASEKDNDRFEVQRSADAVNFTAIGVVPGAGNSTENTNYRFVDAAPLPGLNYYRLRQVDTDGHHEHSAILSVHFEGLTKDVVVYPNPGKDQLNLVLGSRTDRSSYLLVDATGRAVLEGSLAPGMTTLSTGALPNGLYALRVMDAQGSVLHKQAWVKE